MIFSGVYMLIVESLFQQWNLKSKTLVVQLKKSFLDDVKGEVKMK